MKKMFLLVGILLTMAFTVNASGPGFDFTEQFGDGTIEFQGTITSWDENGPHGVVTITVTDRDGNSLSWDNTFSDTSVNTNDPNGIREMTAHPEIASMLEEWAAAQTE